MEETRLLRSIGKSAEDLLQHYENWETWRKNPKTDRLDHSPIKCRECRLSESTMIHAVADFIQARNRRQTED